MTYYTPSISIVCATFNRPRTILRLLDQFNDQRCVDFKAIDVCIADDGTEGPALPRLYGGQGNDDGEKITFDMNGWKYNFSLLYIWRRRHPQNLARVYSSRNLAAAATHGEYILQVDDDVEFHPYLLNMLQSMAGMAQEEHWVWTPRISNNTTSDSAGMPNHGHHASCNWDFGADGRWFDGRVFWQESHWGSADSSGMFMPRRTWEAIGGYDEQFDLCMGAADQELALRVQKLGARPGDVKLWIYPAFMNKADEESGSLRMEMIERALRTGRERNEDIFWRKHPDAREWSNV